MAMLNNQRVTNMEGRPGNSHHQPTIFSVISIIIIFKEKTIWNYLVNQDFLLIWMEPAWWDLSNLATKHGGKSDGSCVAFKFQSVAATFKVYLELDSNQCLVDDPALSSSMNGSPPVLARDTGQNDRLSQGAMAFHRPFVKINENKTSQNTGARSLTTNWS